MRNILLASAAALGLLVAVPARADIGPGDLQDILRDELTSFGGDLLQIIEQLLLAGADLAGGAPWVLNDAMIGDHYSGLPTTPQQAIDYAIGRATDRIARVDGLNGALGTAVDQVVRQLAQMAALAVANSATPFSIASELQIGNAAAIADASTNAALVQHLSNQAALDADEKYHAETDRITLMVATQAWADPVIGGGVEAQTFEMPW